jgi:small subunit ribosomal protein S20
MIRDQIQRRSTQRVANTKSALKQIRVSERKRQRNRPIRTRVKNSITKALDSLTTAGADSVEAVTEAISQLDRAASKGVIHANNAARRKSRLMKKLNAARAKA